MRYKISNKSINALVTILFYLFYTTGFGKNMSITFMLMSILYFTIGLSKLNWIAK